VEKVLIYCLEQLASYT